MVQALLKVVEVAEVAARAAQAVQQLRKTGNEAAARVLEQEASRACAAIVRAATRRRLSAARARKARRTRGGQFIR